MSNLHRKIETQIQEVQLQVTNKNIQQFALSTTDATSSSLSVTRMSYPPRACMPFYATEQARDLCLHEVQV